MSNFGYNVLGFGGGGGPPPPEVDDKFNFTTLLAKFDGANNGVNNAFDDGSTSNHTCTADGLATQGSFGPFARPEGYWGVEFDGDDYLSLPASADYEFGTGDLTVEYWAFPTTSGAVSNILDNRAEATGWKLGRDASGKFQVYNEATTSYLFESGTFPQDAWSHFCWTRASGVNKFFINGVQSGSDVSDNSNFDSNSLNIGVRFDAGSQLFTGSIASVRVIKGTAVEPSGLPTSPPTAVTNTKLLTCQSNRFVDNSTSAHTVTPSGNPSVSAFGPFLTDAAYDPAVNGASTYFSGAEGTAIIITDDLTDFQFGTGAFTVEGWVYRIGGGSAVYTIHQTPVGSGSYLSYGSSGKFNWGSYGNGDNADSTISTALANNQWIYFAVVRTNTNSNGLKIYINGVVDGTFTDTSDYDDTPFNPRIGGFDQGGSRTGNDIHAYISDIRVVKGTAVYTGDFTPPTAPLTAITNTKLLLNMAGGQAIDSAAQNNLTLLGGAKLSTSEVLFGTTSAYFDGSAYMDTNRVLLGPYPENFTVEFWYYGLSAGDVQQLVAQYNSGNATGRMGLNYIQTDTAGVELFLHGSTTLTMRAAAPQGEWVHVALTRSINDFVIYINGTSGATGTSANTIYGINTTIGGSAALTAHGYDFKGYMSDLRITKAVRYTDNFTAPAAPPPIQGQV